MSELPTASNYNEVPEEKKKKRPVPADNPPWNPMLLLGLTFFLSSIVSSIALGINWRRLGKSQWTLPTILVPIGGSILGLLIIIGGISTDLADNYFMLFFTIGYFPIGLGLATIFAVAFAQNGAYTRYQQSNDANVLWDYKYNRTRMIQIAVGGAVAMTLLFGFFMLL